MYIIFILGTKGKRRSLPNSRIMIHQPSGGGQGEASDLEISAKLMLHTKETLNTYMAAFCDQSVDKLRLDTDRDFYMTPQEVSMCVFMYVYTYIYIYIYI
jgi:ATP-dependent Clp protease protease subunit